MAIEVQLSRADGDAPVWGFRFHGGAEFDTPFTVTEVQERSIAASSGVQVDDVILRINDVITLGLTQQQVHDLVVDAGNTLILTLQRGPDQFENIPEGAPDPDRVNEDAIQLTPKFDYEIVEERKWSTFLQRPINPKPKEKIPEGRVIQGEPYRVIIKKQKKKSEKAAEEPKPAETESKKLETCELATEEEAEQVSSTNVEPDEETPQTELIESEDAVERIEEEEECEESRDVEENNNNEEEEYEDRSEAERANSVMTEDSRRNDTSEMARKHSLREKLAEIQRQLEQLAQLPSSIQLTLEEVTKQLVSIVKEEQSAEDDASLADTQTENDITEDAQIDECVSSVNEETVGRTEDDDDENGNQQEQERDEEEEAEATPEEEESQGPTEEELEALRIEEEKLRKQVKEEEEEEERRASGPCQRPIILPGGRRWVQPDDAVPVRKPKMTDEKISSTLDTFAEVNRLNQAWPWSDEKKPVHRINFLKYQPIAKNLDYLKKSEVYRLIHDMEPPVRGICRRPSKILSEQDYYQEGMKGAP